MSGIRSSTDLRTFHGVRVPGSPAAGKLARRFGLDAKEVHETLLDALPLSRLHGQACTNGQLRPTSWDPMGRNDHTDLRWDTTAVHELDRLAPLGIPLGSDG